MSRTRARDCRENPRKAAASLDGIDTEGVPFSLITTWDSWLEAGQPGTPSDECDTGTGGTFSTATLERHVDRQPADLSGVIDNEDWNPNALPEVAEGSPHSGTRIRF